MFSAHLRDLRPRKLPKPQLAQTRLRCTMVFDHAVQAMALIDPDGTVLEMNAAARQADARGAGPTRTALRHPAVLVR